jgi:nicotianamine synthase
MEARAIYEELSNVADLRPSEAVNALFARLVRVALSPEVQAHDLSCDDVARLQALCGAGEYELERFWVEETLAAADPPAALRRFPYFQNYVNLTRLEWSSLTACQRHRSHSILFCGGGPLPLTAILLARNYGIRSMVIDNCPDAVELSTRLVEALGLGGAIEIVHADARAYGSFEDYNTIFVAALAGVDDAAKADIFRRIRLEAPEDAHVMARSSWGNRTLLYRPLPRTIYDELVPVAEVRPPGDIVNSIVIFRRP